MHPSQNDTPFIAVKTKDKRFTSPTNWTMQKQIDRTHLHKNLTKMLCVDLTVFPKIWRKTDRCSSNRTVNDPKKSVPAWNSPIVASASTKLGVFLLK
jgi:hypothetical protein